MGMSPTIPIYRQACQICQGPALTLDPKGLPFCRRHAKVFIPSNVPDLVVEDLKRRSV